VVVPEIKQPVEDKHNGVPARVGDTLGDEVIVIEGTLEGFTLGLALGFLLGIADGNLDGKIEGLVVVGIADGV
jgi:hypothetical protein